MAGVVYDFEIDLSALNVTAPCPDGHLEKFKILHTAVLHQSCPLKAKKFKGRVRRTLPP
ncbi:MAG: hypothetical protein RLZZ435_1354 [Cyanobacteriota bacterium]|jgi:hypothetical protein